MKKPWLRRPIAIVSSLAVVATIGLVAPASSGATTMCASPPPVVDVGDLTPGTMGTAWTVVQGTTPVSFDVEILGTLTDGIAPGIDFILIKVSGPVIDDTGGIAAGMSGSPVYVGGDLAGAISYGFFGADPTIGGMTPAAAMEHILDFPQPAMAGVVKIGHQLQRAYASASETTTLVTAPTTAKRLSVPLMVSGTAATSTKAQGRLQHWMTKNGSPFVVTTGASAPAPEAVSLGSPPVAGGAIGAVYSFGDATFGALGTATFVCDDEVVAFGHPFNHEGRTSLALTNADILHTVPDPSQVFGPFKIGAVTDASGSITQDRLAGIGGITGTLPDLAPVTTDLSYDTLGTSDSGETDVASQRYIPYISYAHLYTNIATLTDADGPGSATLDVTINGLDESSNPWTVDVADTYSSDYDIADEAGYEAVYRNLAQLVYQNFEDITITDVNVTGSLSDDNLTARIQKVLSRTGLQHGYKARRVIEVRPGRRIDLRVMLMPAEADAPIAVDFTVKAPRKLGGSGTMYVLGGGFRIREHADSFADLVDQLNDQPKQSDVTAAIFGRGLREPEQTSASAGYVVRGNERLRLEIVR